MALHGDDDDRLQLLTTPRELSETPPKTGTTLPFIWPPPEHLQIPPPFEEPVLSCPSSEELVARETELDALRCGDPRKHQGEQVYDSLTPPPHRDYKHVKGATAAAEMPRWYGTQGPDDETVLFESRFESGNLRNAERIDESEYNLQLAFDINTDRHTQWFYFSMSNLQKARRYKLNMQNLLKTEAVYNLGMQPLAYSEKRAAKEGVGWYRTGSNVCYFKNQVARGGSKPFWTLTFVVHTAHDGDTLYLAHCFPYRYTDLQRHLSKLVSSPLGRSLAIRRRALCQTLAGNDCDVITITSPTADDSSKKGVVISARVHPGETNASWMMKGVLDYLTSDSLQAAALRDKFVFKIVPMLNPDGVIVGNYRCSLAGGDLNRQYEDPKRELFPEVLNLKQMIANFSMTKEVVLFVDLHGHSKKSNIFMYGVDNPTDEGLYMRERVIPTLLDRASPLFNLRDCSFDVGKGKEGCGRVVVRKQLGIVNAYTMEASFMGADQGYLKGIHFNQGHLESMGHSLCDVLLEIADPDQSRLEEIVRDLVKTYPIDQSRVVVRQDDDSDDSSSDGSETPKRLPSRQRKPSKPLKGGSSPLHRGKEKMVRRKATSKNKDSGSFSTCSKEGGDRVNIAPGRASRPRTSGKSGKREKPALAISHSCDGLEGEALGAGVSKKAVETTKKVVGTDKKAVGTPKRAVGTKKKANTTNKVVGTAKKAASQKVGTPKKPPLIRKPTGLASTAASNDKVGRRKTSAASATASARTAVESTTRQQLQATIKYCAGQKVKRVGKRVPTVDALAPSEAAAAPSDTAVLLRPARRPSSSPGSRSISNPRRRLSSEKVAKRSVLSAPSKGAAAASTTRRVSGSESGLIREAFVVKTRIGDARNGLSTVFGGKERRKMVAGKDVELPLLP